MTQDTAISNRIRPLRNVAAMMHLVERVETRPDFLPGIATFSGPTGYGKTFAAAQIVRSHQAIHIECCSFWTQKALLMKILGELGEKQKGTIFDLFERARLALLKSGRPLLVDEADKISKSNMIETIRNLHDQTQVSVILIGEESLPQMLRAVERLDGRIFDWVQAQPADLDDTRMLAGFYAQGVEIEDAILARILDASHGQVRRISSNLAFVKEQALATGITQMTAEIWGDRAFRTAEAPKPRRNLA